MVLILAVTSVVLFLTGAGGIGPHTDDLFSWKGFAAFHSLEALMYPLIRMKMRRIDRNTIS